MRNRPDGRETTAPNIGVAPTVLRPPAEKHHDQDNEDDPADSFRRRGRMRNSRLHPQTAKARLGLIARVTYRLLEALSQNDKTNLATLQHFGIGTPSAG